MQKIHLTGTALKAIMIAAAAQDVRYYLNGVLIEATEKETRLVATDGHRLAGYRIPASNVLDAPIHEFIIPSQAIKQIKVSKKSHLDFLVIEIDDGKYTLVNGGIRIGFEPIDGRFPDYRRIMPTECDGQLQQFNPDLLAGFHEIGRLLLNAKTAVPFVEHNSKGASRVVIKGLPMFIGAVMAYDADKLKNDPEPWPALSADDHAALAAQRDAKAKKLAA